MKATILFRWIARIGSIGSIGLILAFIIGEGAEGYPHTWQQWIGFLFFPAGIATGMILGWWREAAGGAITMGGLVMFYAVYFLLNSIFPRGLAWVIFASPGALFLASSWLRSRSKNAQKSDD